MKRSAIFAIGVLLLIPVVSLAVTVNWNYTPPAAVAEGAPYTISITPSVSGGYFDAPVQVLVFYGTGSTYTTHNMTQSGSTYTYTIPGNRIAFPTLKIQLGCSSVYDSSHGWWESLYSDLYNIPVGAYVVASAGSNGSISPSGSVPFSLGENKTFTMTPASAAYVVDTVTVDGSSVGAPTSYTFYNLLNGHTIHATFKLKTFTVTASAGTGGTITPSGDQTITYGTNASFTIAASPGYLIDDVQVDGESVGAVTSHTITNVTDDHTILATFVLATHYITASAGSGGSISPTGSVTVDHGDPQSFTITPATGHHVSDVLVDGVSQGAITSYEFATVTTDHTIAASFAPDTYSITVASGTGGSTDQDGTQTIAYGTTFTVTPTPATGYHFTGWSGDASGNANPLSVTITGPLSITANFALNQYSVTVASSGNGSTDKDGTQTITHGDSITITPTPSTGYHFNSWTGDASGSADPLTVTVTGNLSITATFAINQYTVTVASGGNGSTDKDGANTVNHGDSITITPTGATGYHFASWSGDASGSADPLTVTVTNNLSITATFAINQYTVTVASGGNGSTDKDGANTVNHGDSITITPTGATGYHFASWSGDASGSADPLTVTVTSNLSITATFAINQYTVTVASGGNGTTDKDGANTVNHGDSITITPTGATGYHFASWSGDASGSTDPLTLTVTGNLSITATFAINQYTVTVASVGTGTTDKDGSHTVNHGDSITITPAAGTGHHFANWSGDASGSANPLTVTVTGNLSITATFAINQYTVTVSSGGNGTTDKDGTNTVNHGDSITITPNGATGYHFANWSGDTSGSANPLTLTVTGDLSVTAHFAINQYTVTVVSDPHGSTDKNGAHTLNHGEVITITAAAETGYHFNGWSGDASGTTNPLILTATATVTVRATFVPDTQTVTVIAGPGGSTDRTGTHSVDYGSSFTVKATPDSSHLFAGWTGGASGKANPLTVTVKANLTITATFEEKAGTLSVSIDPVSIRSVAAWRANGGAWNTHGATIELPAGTATIEFIPVDGWITPAAQTVEITAAALKTASGLYRPASGSLQVTLGPDEALDGGAAWRVDGGEWRSTATTVDDLAAGSHSISFKTIAGWTTPDSIAVDIVAGQTATAAANYQRRPQPVVHYFTTSAGTAAPGDVIELRWMVDGAQSVSISPDIGDTLPASGSRSVVIEDTTTWTLTAVNDGGETTARVQVTSLARPEILWFAARTPVVTRGSAATLAFAVNGAARVRVFAGETVFYDGADTVADLSVNLADTTTLTVRATNASGTVEAQTQVRVVDLPTIRMFAATPQAITEGGAATLSWDVTGADSVSISPGSFSSAAASGTRAVSPQTTVLYRLTAGNVAGAVSAEVEVTVKPLPKTADLALEFDPVGGALPAQVLVGTSYAIPVLVTNAGPADARNVTVEIRENDVVYGRSLIPSVKAGTQAQVTFVWRASAEGRNALLLAVDPEGMIADPDRGNNAIVRRTKAVSAEGVDLAVTRLSVRKSPLEQKYEASLVIVNAGARAASGFQYEVELRSVRDEVIGNLLVDRIQSLAPGEKIEVRIPFVCVNKKFSLLATVDVHKAVVESEEDNNALTCVVTAKLLP